MQQIPDHRAYRPVSRNPFLNGGHIMKKLICLCLFTILSMPGPVSGDTSIGVGLAAGYHEPMNARDSYRAVYDSGNLQLGLVCDYRLCDWLSLDFRITNFNKSGRRVTIDETGNITKTNNTEDLQIWSVTAGARWHFLQGHTILPYAGVAVGGWSISTESALGDSSLTYDKTGIGAMVMTGLQIFPQNRFSYGFDVSYSFVPDMIGDEPGTVSNVYGDTDIGGLSVGALIQFRF
jgi:opacity protein-like surface antigen